VLRLRPQGGRDRLPRARALQRPVGPHQQLAVQGGAGGGHKDRGRAPHKFPISRSLNNREFGNFSRRREDLRAARSCRGTGGLPHPRGESRGREGVHALQAPRRLVGPGRPAEGIAPPVPQPASGVIPRGDDRPHGGREGSGRALGAPATGEVPRAGHSLRLSHRHRGRRPSGRSWAGRSCSCPTPTREASLTCSG